MSFDGSRSTDNVGIASYTWTFMDGSMQTLSGMTASYVFATPGTYVVTLTVRDADGNVGTDSLIVTVRDVTAPTITVSSPSEGASVPGSVVIVASATDNTAVVRVEFFVDGVSVGNDTTAPFQWPLAARSVRWKRYRTSTTSDAGAHRSRRRYEAAVLTLAAPVAR